MTILTSTYQVPFAMGGIRANLGITSSKFGGDTQTNLPAACTPVYKISNAMNNDGVITSRDLGNEFEALFFLCKKTLLL